MANFAYLRVSTDQQSISNQRNHIESLGFNIDQWFEDEAVSGTTEALKRKGLSSLLAQAQEGDCIIAVEVSRLGRSTSDVLNLIDILKKRKIKLRIVNLDGIDLVSPTGTLLLTMMISCAQFERDLLVQRTKIGLKRAQAEGKILGRKLELDPDTIKKMLKAEGKAADIAYKFGISERQYYRYKKEFKNGGAAYAAKYELQKGIV